MHCGAPCCNDETLFRRRPGRAGFLTFTQQFICLGKKNQAILHGFDACGIKTRDNFSRASSNARAGKHDATTKLDAAKPGAGEFGSH